MIEYGKPNERHDVSGVVGSFPSAKALVLRGSWRVACFGNINANKLDSFWEPTAFLQFPREVVFSSKDADTFDDDEGVIFGRGEKKGIVHDDGAAFVVGW